MVDHTGTGPRSAMDHHFQRWISQAKRRRTPSFASIWTFRFRAAEVLGEQAILGAVSAIRPLVASHRRSGMRHRKSGDGSSLEHQRTFPADLKFPAPGQLPSGWSLKALAGRHNRLYSSASASSGCLRSLSDSDSSTSSCGHCTPMAGSSQAMPRSAWGA